LEIRRFLGFFGGIFYKNVIVVIFLTAGRGRMSWTPRARAARGSEDKKGVGGAAKKAKYGQIG